METRRLLTLSLGERIRLACIELGPSFVKFAQLLSNRKDIVPEPILVELEKLQDRVPPFPAEEARQIVEEELHKPIEHLFLDFFDEPEAAASIAQVHRAILPTGLPVAVKIKRPGIDEQIRADVQIMHQISRLFGADPRISALLSPEDLVHEFEKQMARELDFREELLSLKRFKESFAEDPTVRIPDAYGQYTTPNVLVLEFIHGRKVSWVMRTDDPGYDKKLINHRTADFIMTQLFVHGFFHADPHPGNFLVLRGNIVCFIDFGMVYSLRPYEQEHLNYLMLGLARYDPTLVARSLLKISRSEGQVNREAFEAAVYDYIEANLDRPLEFVDLAAALVQLLQMIARFGIRLPPRLVYVAKVFGTLEAVGSGLDPDFQLLTYLEEFSARIWANQMGSRRTGNRVLVSSLNWSELALQAPEVIQNVGRLLRDRKITMEIPEAAGLRQTVDKVGFRLVFGLVLSAMLISSALVILSGVGPKYQGIPLLGIVGFAIGAVMGAGFLLAGIVKLFKWRGDL
ncbi:ABC1 kinase family protein [Salinispira pacifica]